MSCKDGKLIRLFNFLLVISPIANVYASFIPGVSIGELVLGFLTIIAFFASKSVFPRKCEAILCLYLVYSLLISFQAYLFGYYQFHCFNRLVRYSFYTVAIFAISRTIFNKGLFFAYFDFMSLVILFSLLFQYLVFFARGSYIRLFGNFLPLFDVSRLTINYEMLFSNSFFRPSSFFTEPAHLCQYLFLPLTFNLFYVSQQVNEKNKRIRGVLVSSICIILSTSLYGFGLLFFEITIWYFVHLFKSKKAKWLFIFPLVVLVFMVIVNTTAFKNSISRINLSSIAQSATFTGRFEGYIQVFRNNSFRILFGSGFGNIGASTYSNSIVYILSGTGIVGLLFWIIQSVYIFGGKLVFWKKNLYSCFVLLLFGSSIILSITFSLVFIIIFSVE